MNDELPKIVYWIDDFSVLSFFTIFKLSAGRQAEIIFHSSTKVFLLVFSFLNMLFRKRFNTRKINYSLGDMRSANGQSLRYEVEERSAEMAKKMSELLVRTDEYRAIKSLFPSDKLIIYYQKRIMYEIYSLVRTVCIIDYHKRNGNKDLHYIVWPRSSLFKSLNSTWDEGVPLLYTFQKIININYLKYKGKELYIWFESFVYRIFYKSSFEKNIDVKSPQIAIHYFDGIDLSKRNDIFWLQDSKINPDNILIYCDGCSFALSPINIQVSNELNKKRLKCIFLRRNPLQKLKPVWAEKISTGKVKKTFKKNLTVFPSSPLKEWIIETANDLIYNVLYWMAFYSAFNIKIDIDIEEVREVRDTSVSKAISLDILGGFLVGYQRSELLETPGICFGLHPHHIFFTWNKRTIKCLEMNENKNNVCVISGYCYDYIFKDHVEECNRTKKRFNDHGAKLIIALYDNAFGIHTHFSKNMMDSFYKGFLEWVLTDEEVVLMIKPKKTWFLEKNLPDIKKLLDKTQATGRCIIYPHSQGHFPSNIAMAADFAVGVGISSALIEAVLSGTRGLFCDLTCNKSHYFFQVGYNKVDIHNIDYLIELLKKYKSGDENLEYLGDFSSWLDFIDPFHDGMANKRIGSYLDVLLRGFKHGLNKDVIIKNSNSTYEKIWGTDRIVMNNQL